MNRVQIIKIVESSGKDLLQGCEKTKTTLDDAIDDVPAGVLVDVAKRNASLAAASMSKSQSRMRVNWHKRSDLFQKQRHHGASGEL